MLRKINLVCVGTLKKDYLRNLDNKYRTSINLITIKESTINHESEAILNAINKVPKSNCILFDLDGKIIYEVTCRDKLCNSLKGDIYFIIGGSDGVNDKVRSRCGTLIKLSDFTYTHQLFRVVALLFINKIMDLK